MAGPVVSCSSAESERTVTKDVEEGFLEPAPRVFGDEDGSETEVTSPSLRGEVMNHSTDSFVPYVDPPRDVSQYCGDNAYDPALDRAIQECDQVRQEGIDCLVEFGPFVAPLFGVGAGFLWPVSEHRLRLDLLYQFSKRTLYRQEAEASDSAAEARVTMDTSRLWLSLGFEI